MKQTENKFHSPELQNVTSEAEPIFTAHLHTLDHISKDIKFLEERLDKAAIPFFYAYVFSVEKARIRRMKYRYLPDQEIPIGAGLFESHEEHCLVWGKNANNQYRLSYNVYISEDAIEEYQYEGKETTELVERLKPRLKYSKPLIESKAHIRIKVASQLPNFYRHLTNALKSQKGVGVIIECSPEFGEKHLLPQLWFNSIDSLGKIDETIFVNN